MNASSRNELMQSRVSTRRENYYEADRRKRLLANSILIRIREELTATPGIDSFTYPLEPKHGLGRLERFVLSHYPDDIATRVRSDRSVSLEYDANVEPPLLTVRLGESPLPDEVQNDQ